MKNDILTHDQGERYSLFPLYAANSGRLRGLVFRLAPHITLEDVANSLAPVGDYCREISDCDYHSPFTPFSSIKKAREKGFGFKNGLRLLRRHGRTRIEVSLKQEYFPGYSSVLNLQWMFHTLERLGIPQRVLHDQPTQLFQVDTFTPLLEEAIGWGLTIRVSRAASRTLQGWGRQSFLAATATMQALLRRGNIPADQASVGMGDMKTLHINGGHLSWVGTAWEATAHRNRDHGYIMHSKDVATPILQLAHLVGLAAVWEQLIDQRDAWQLSSLFG